MQERCDVALTCDPKVGVVDSQGMAPAVPPANNDVELDVRHVKRSVRRWLRPPLLSAEKNVPKVGCVINVMARLGKAQVTGRVRPRAGLLGV